MSSSSVITVDKLGKTYSAHLFQKPTRALLDVSFQVNKGEVFGIVGPNGAGKSTLLKILLGFIQNNTGTAHIRGLSPASPESRRSVGYLPETSCLYSHLSIHDHLQFAGRLHNFSKNTTKTRTTALLEQVGLSHVIHKPIRSYSKGMAQRAALAYALFHEPDILILDEPMSGLDPIGRQLVVDLIHEYNNQGHTILFCSHILTDVERICHRIGILNKGKLESIISPKDLPPPSTHSFNQSPLEAFFLDTIQSGTEGRQ